MHECEELSEARNEPPGRTGGPGTRHSLRAPTSSTESPGDSQGRVHKGLSSAAENNQH